MEKATIIKLNKSFEDSAYELDGVEYWFARVLLVLLGYTNWRNFLNSIDKAKESCKNTFEAVSDHFVDVNKMIDIGFANIISKGDLALFGISTNNMKKKLGVPENRPLADFLPTITITAKQLATEIINFNVNQNDLNGETSITIEHVKNNKDIRGLLGKSGIKPEQLPAEEDIKKLELKVKSADRGIEKIKLKGKK